MCSYLTKRGIKFKPNDIPQIKYFLNYWQKRIMQTSYFKTKEEIIKDLLSANKKTNLLLMLFK
jgi:hypothetical protein